ncbi:MAG: L-tyrosine/L-tryptophan isonitrile synthase family protein, partial [Myxococcota bacterium]
MTLLAAAGPTETSSVAHPCRTDHNRSHRSVARRILSELMRYRRIAGDDAPCELGCRKCHAPHIEKIVACLKNGEPLVLVLPAFPGKSPNPAKVLGPLPDMAEQRALQFLNSVYQRLAVLEACDDLFD